MGSYLWLVFLLSTIIIYLSSLLAVTFDTRRMVARNSSNNAKEWRASSCHILVCGCLKVDCWLTVISGGYSYDNLSRLSPPAVSTAWRKVLPSQDSDPTLGYVCTTTQTLDCHVLHIWSQRRCWILHVNRYTETAGLAYTVEIAWVSYAFALSGSWWMMMPGWLATVKKVHYLVKWIDSTGQQSCRGS